MIIKGCRDAAQRVRHRQWHTHQYTLGLNIFEYLIQCFKMAQHMDLNFFRRIGGKVWGKIRRNIRGEIRGKIRGRGQGDIFGPAYHRTDYLQPRLGAAQPPRTHPPVTSAALLRPPPLGHLPSGAYRYYRPDQSDRSSRINCYNRYNPNQCLLIKPHTLHGRYKPLKHRVKLRPYKEVERDVTVQ